MLLNRPAAWMQRHDGIVGQVAVRSRRAAAMPSCPIPGGERAAGQQPPALAQPARHVSHRHAGCHALSFRGEARWLDELGGSGMHGIGGSSCRQGRPRQQRGPWWQQRQLSGGGGGGSNSGGSNSGGRSRATGLAVVITPIGMPEGERRRVRAGGSLCLARRERRGSLQVGTWKQRPHTDCHSASAQACGHRAAAAAAAARIAKQWRPAPRAANALYLH